MPTLRTEQVQSCLRRDHIHERWRSEYLNPELDRFYDVAFERLVEKLGASEGARILDAGCGYCFHALRLARYGLQVTGVDFSETALRQGRANVERAGVYEAVCELAGTSFEAGRVSLQRAWFEKVGSHRGAMGNVLIFQKAASA